MHSHFKKSKPWSLTAWCKVVTVKVATRLLQVTTKLLQLGLIIFEARLWQGCYKAVTRSLQGTTRLLQGTTRLLQLRLPSLAHVGFTCTGIFICIKCTWIICWTVSLVIVIVIVYQYHVVSALISTMYGFCFSIYCVFVTLYVCLNSV